MHNAIIYAIFVVRVRKYLIVHLSKHITSIDIEVPASTSILFQFGIDIGIDDTFIASIDIEYRQYF